MIQTDLVTDCQIHSKRFLDYITIILQYIRVYDICIYCIIYATHYNTHYKTHWNICLYESFLSLQRIELLYKLVQSFRNTLCIILLCCFFNCVILLQWYKIIISNLHSIIVLTREINSIDSNFQNEGRIMFVQNLNIIMLRQCACEWCRAKQA